VLPKRDSSEMSSHLKQLDARIAELNKLGVEVIHLGGLLGQGKWLEASALKDKAEEWYRGGRALLERENFSGLADFDLCYRAHYPDPVHKNQTTVDWPLCTRVIPNSQVSAANFDGGSMLLGLTQTHFFISSTVIPSPQRDRCFSGRLTNGHFEMTSGFNFSKSWRRDAGTIHSSPA
jgi:hypothetical protein